MYEREITAMDFRAINRAVSRRAASKEPDAAAMRALRPALWFLWLSGARVEEMRFAHWDEFKPARARLVVHTSGKQRVLDLMITQTRHPVVVRKPTSRKQLTLCINSDAVGGAYKEADCFHLPDRACPAGLNHPQACYCQCASVDYVGTPTNNLNAPAKEQVAVVRVLACNFPFDRNGQEFTPAEVAAPARLHHQRKDPKPRTRGRLPRAAATRPACGTNLRPLLPARSRAT